jgi:tetratricopeptide (TPR) repeat protein/DNA-binding MarR family transcriptional regulator
MSKKLKFFVSTENKILLHLKKFVKVDFTKKVPYEIIQGGIAESLGSPRGSVSRALGNLIKKGFIEEKLCRVASSKRRMNAYFLTWEGRSQTESLEARLAIELVEVRIEDGTLTEATISEALELSGNGLSVSELLRILEVHGYYDPILHHEGEDREEPASGVSLRPAGQAAGGITPVVAPAPDVRPGTAAQLDIPRKEVPAYTKIPVVRTFFGRTEELERFPKLIKDFPVLIIQGMPGIGKTTMAAKIISLFDPTYKIFWYRLQEWDNSASILQGLAEFFNSFGHDNLIKELESTRYEPDMYRILRILVHEFNNIKALLVIDDFHRATESVQQLMTGFIENLNSKSLVHLMFITRMHIPIFDQRDTALKKNVHIVKLDGLDEPSSREMIGGRKVSETDFNRIYKLTRGHPLALELIKSTGKMTDYSDMMKFINEQVFLKLSKAEKEILRAISVHRHPVPIDSFLIEDETDFETADNLINKNLLIEIELNTYDVHDLIREFFYTRLLPKNRKRLHRIAAEYYANTIQTDLNILETVYHYINAGDQDSAAELMITKAPNLISRGYLDEAMNILTKFDTSLNPEFLARLYTIKGDILSTWGEWDNVFEYYWQCYFMNLLKDSPEPKRKLLDSIGYIGWKSPEVESALKNLTSSLKVIQSAGDEDGIIEIQNSLAWLNWMTGNYDKAESIYKKLEQQMHSYNDSQGSAKILIKLGNVYWADNKIDLSMKSYEKGLELFQSINDDHGTIRTYSQIALVYLEQGEHLKADENLKKCLELSDQIQFKKGLGYGLLHLVQNLAAQKQYADAITKLDQTQTTFEILQDNLGIAYTYSLKGLIHEILKQNKKAIESFEKAIDHLHGFLMPYFKSKLYEELSALYKLIGDSEKAADAKKLAKEKQE